MKNEGPFLLRKLVNFYNFHSKSKKMKIFNVVLDNILTHKKNVQLKSDGHKSKILKYLKKSSFI